MSVKYHSKYDENRGETLTTQENLGLLLYGWISYQEEEKY